MCVCMRMHSSDAMRMTRHQHLTWLTLTHTERHALCIYTHKHSIFAGQVMSVVKFKVTWIRLLKVAPKAEREKKTTRETLSHF